ncbi:MAG: hypothetical protein R2874_09920 [Desulfobacterales bacterium]
MILVSVAEIFRKEPGVDAPRDREARTPYDPRTLRERVLVLVNGAFV